jgi:ABC transporter substrate binding protein
VALTLALGLLAGPVGVQAQPGKVFRIGYLGFAIPSPGCRPTGVTRRSWERCASSGTTRGGISSLSPFREITATGGLISFGPNIVELIRHSATFVDKFLRGARPGEVPVEQPTRFEVSVNLKTAKALGLRIPSSVLARAEEIIE